jgi:hypothetical protein
MLALIDSIVVSAADIFCSLLSLLLLQEAIKTASIIV